jgi:polysaccharide pyruvyl transferase WcaK-like protein
MGFAEEEFSIDFVTQNQVPKYLSAADFAFSLHRPTPSKQAISPIKNAEFWANGLPIIMPDGIGDDSHLTKTHRLGVVIEDFSKISTDHFEELSSYFTENRKVNDRVRFAKEHRGFDIVEKCYAEILSSISTSIND